MLMILARLVCSESFWAVVKVRSPHTGPEVSYPRRVPRAALNLAEYTSRYHPASRRSGCLICRKTPTSLLLEESFR